MSLENVEAVVLAAGEGRRMRSARAKVLHELLGRPILRYPLAALAQAGIERPIVITGVQAEEVEKAAAGGARFVRQPLPDGTGGALRAAREALAGFSGDLLVVCGDAPLLSARTINRLVAVLRSEKADAVVLTACVDDPSQYGRVVRDEQGRVARIVEDRDASPREREIQEINSGTFAFRATALAEALETLEPHPPQGEFYLTDAVERFARAGRKVLALRSEDPAEAYGINTRKDLVAATNYLRWKILERHMDAGVSIVDPSTTYIEMDVEIGEDTVVWPFSVIRHGVRIGRGCQVGPFAHLRGETELGDGAEIGNFVEVKKSRIGAGSKAKHLAYLGDAVLGARVNIGAGTITANYDAGKKNTTVLEDGAFTGCNTVLVAPVRMGKNSKTGAGAVVPKGQDVPEGTVVVGVPARPLERRER